MTAEAFDRLHMKNKFVFARNDLELLEDVRKFAANDELRKFLISTFIGFLQQRVKFVNSLVENSLLL